jgi:hypothetical protein
MTVFVDQNRLRLCFGGRYVGDPLWLDLPDDAQILAFERHPAKPGFDVAINSPRFMYVSAGERIPEMAWQLPGNPSWWRR